MRINHRFEKHKQKRKRENEREREKVSVKTCVVRLQIEKSIESVTEIRVQRKQCAEMFEICEMLS